MFKKLAVILLMLSAIGLYAEDETNMDQVSKGFEQQNLLNVTSVGGAIGVTARGTFIDNRLYPSPGGELYALLNHSVMIGISGYGVPLNFRFDGTNTNGSGIGWGGLLLGYIFMPEWVVHPYIKTVIGAGGIGFYQNPASMGGNAFFVFEGELGLELNIFKWMRIAPYAGYHLMAGDFDILGMNAMNLSGWHFGVTLRFGLF